MQCAVKITIFVAPEINDLICVLNQKLYLFLLRKLNHGEPCFTGEKDAKMITGVTSGYSH